MSQNSCCIPGCAVTSDDGVPLHKFPYPDKDPGKFKAWLSNIGGEICTLDPVYIFNNKRVCRRHFEDCYLYPKNRLCRLAIPVLLMPGVREQPVVANNALPEHVQSEAASNAQVVSSEIPVSGVREQPVVANNALPEHVQSEAASNAQVVPSECSDILVTGGSSFTSELREVQLPLRTYERKRKQPCDPCSPPQNYGKRMQKQVMIGVNAAADIIPPAASVTGDVPTNILISGPGESNMKAQGQRNQTRKHKSAKKGIRVSMDQYKNYKALVKRLQKAEKDKILLKKKLVLAKKIKKSTAFNMIAKKMSPTSRILCEMQVSQSGKKKRGRRFTLEEKILALSMYKPSPKAYRLLSKLCVLPSRRTLQNLLGRISLKAGLNELIFQNLKSKVDKMPESHKYCVLLFDEMAIGPGVSYNKKKDQLSGFVDDGHTRTNEYCDHVLVFMIRGAIKKFKQPLAFYYCHGSTKTVSLKTQIRTVIKKIHEAGLKVISTVCDQGASNVAAINQLINETKAEYLRNGQEIRENFFKVENCKIFPIFDPPHLIKGIRNNLLTKNLRYLIKGKVRVAKWEHIVALYKRSPGYKGVKLVPKLTAQHVLPEHIPKMRVKHCTQVFSQSVGVALGYMAESGAIEKACTDTADLLMFFDDLFDSVNGSYSQVRNGKIYRTALTPSSPHHKLWANSLPVLKSMSFINGNKQGLVPSLTSWVKTIEGFKAIAKHMNMRGMNSLLLRNFNQDALENFFGAIRAHGCSNIMPTASAFEGAFKTLLINNISSSHSVGSNCEKDDSVCLQSLQQFLNKPEVDETDETQTEFEGEIESAHVCIDLLDTEHLLQSKNPESLEKSAAIGYCSGWLAQQAKKHVYKDCEICIRNMEESEPQSFHSFIKMKEYEGKGWLCYPTRPLFDFFAQVEHISIEILKEHCHRKDLALYIRLVVQININVTFLSCVLHKDALCKYLINKSTVFFINNWCTDVNNLINGKITFWDHNDPMKERAFRHYSKNKGRKRKTQNDILVNV